MLTSPQTPSPPFDSSSKTPSCFQSNCVDGAAGKQAANEIRPIPQTQSEAFYTIIMLEVVVFPYLSFSVMGGGDSEDLVYL